MILPAQAEPLSCVLLATVPVPRAELVLEPVPYEVMVLKPVPSAVTPQQVSKPVEHQIVSERLRGSRSEGKPCPSLGRESGTPRERGAAEHAKDRSSAAPSGGPAADQERRRTIDNRSRSGERRGEGLFPSFENRAFSAEPVSHAELVRDPVPGEALVLKPVSRSGELVLGPVQVGPCAVAPSAPRGRFAPIAPGRLAGQDRPLAVRH
jgi:hypothetical protein